MPASIKHYDTSQLNQFFRATTWNYHWIWVKVSDPCIPFTFRQKHFLTLRFANGKKGEREDYQGVISAPKLTRPHPMREGGNCFWAWGEAVIGWKRRRGGQAWKLIGDLVPCGGKIWKELLFNVKSCQQSRIQNRLFFHFSLSFPFRVRIRQRILHSSSSAHFLSKSNCRLLCKCQSKHPSPPPCHRYHRVFSWALYLCDLFCTEQPLISIHLWSFWAPKTTFWIPCTTAVMSVAWLSNYLFNTCPIFVASSCITTIKTRMRK